MSKLVEIWKSLEVDVKVRRQNESKEIADRIWSLFLNQLEVALKKEQCPKCLSVFCNYEATDEVLYILNKKDPNIHVSRRTRVYDFRLKK